MVAGDALAIIADQIQLGGQGQESGQQQPVEPGGALENGPGGQPGDRLDAQLLKWGIDGLAQQQGREGDAGEQQVAQQ
jgi:hypothetical protein